MRGFVRHSRIALVAVAFYGTTAMAGSGSSWSWRAFLAWLWQQIEEAIDEHCGDEEEAEEEPISCPCFDAASLDADLGGYSHEALSWASRPKGTLDEYSLRGYTWEEDPLTGEWSSPTVAFDVYRQAADDAPYCSEWSQTWLAAPHHTWDSDYAGSETALSEDEYTHCRDLLDTWTADNAVPLTSW